MRRSQQTNAESDNRDCENERSSIDQRDTRLRGSWRQNRKEEPRRNENCSEWHSDSNEPDEGQGWVGWLAVQSRFRADK